MKLSGEVMKKTIKNLFYVDLRALAAVRIFLGICLTYLFLTHLFSASAMLSDEGLLPRNNVIMSDAPFNFSLFYISGHPLFQYFLLTIGLITSIMFTLGKWSKSTGAFCWVLLVSIIYRNGPATYGAHNSLSAFLFWALLAPLDKAYSIENGQQNSATNKVQQNLIFSVGGLGLLLQWGILILGAATFKAEHKDFWVDSGVAVQNFLSLSNNKTFISNFIFQFPVLMKFFSIVSYYYELLIFPILFIPWKTGSIRIINFIFGLFFFLGIALVMSVGIFPLVTFAASLIYLPSSAWNWFDKTTLAIKTLNLINNFSQIIENIRNFLSNNILTKYTSKLTQIGLFIFLSYFSLNALRIHLPGQFNDSKNFLSKHFYLDAYQYLRLNTKWNLYHRRYYSDDKLIVETENYNNQYETISPNDEFKIPILTATPWPQLLNSIKYSSHRSKLNSYAQYLCRESLQKNGFNAYKVINFYTSVKKIDDNMTNYKEEKRPLLSHRCFNYGWSNNGTCALYTNDNKGSYVRTLDSDQPCRTRIGIQYIVENNTCSEYTPYENRKLIRRGVPMSLCQQNGQNPS